MPGDDDELCSAGAKIIINENLCRSVHEHVRTLAKGQAEHRRGALTPRINNMLMI